MSDKCKKCDDKLGHEDDSSDTCRWCISGWAQAEEEIITEEAQEQDNER